MMKRMLINGVLCTSFIFVLFLMLVFLARPVLFIQNSGRVQVVDDGTGEPVVGAIVTLSWGCSKGGLVAKPCALENILTTTDQQGFFQIPHFQRFFWWTNFFMDIGRSQPHIRVNKGLYSLKRAFGGDAVWHWRVIKRVDVINSEIRIKPWTDFTEAGYEDYFTSWKGGHSHSHVLNYCSEGGDQDLMTRKALERDVAEQRFVSMGATVEDWLRGMDGEEYLSDRCSQLQNFLLEKRSIRK